MKKNETRVYVEGVNNSGEFLNLAPGAPPGRDAAPPRPARQRVGPAAPRVVGGAARGGRGAGRARPGACARPGGPSRWAPRRAAAAREGRGGAAARGALTSPALGPAPPRPAAAAAAEPASQRAPPPPPGRERSARGHGLGPRGGGHAAEAAAHCQEGAASAFQVKQIMEEAVTRKFVHEDSSHIISFCAAVEACVLHGLRRLAFCTATRLQLSS
ncbi:uncharacterized protein LOC144299630 [Canis aureus]